MLQGTLSRCYVYNCDATKNAILFIQHYISMFMAFHTEFIRILVKDPQMWNDSLDPLGSHHRTMIRISYYKFDHQTEKM
jgi:hypothetical protein